MNYTDDQLQKALAKMLPEQIRFIAFTDDSDEYGFLYWKDKNQHPLQSEVRDTELLHLCWMVEETLNEINSADYAELLRPISANYKLLYHASWQQRVESLAEVKGIKI
tara:strand:+ start:47 stop:370 length:324 start_codon:yes stop_codon:yes gene_type:complete